MRRPMDNPALYRLLGEKVASARSRHEDEPSQSELARRVGLTRGSIANIELGTQRAPLHVIWAIAQALGIDPASLIPRADELEDAAKAFAPDEKLEPQVERVVEEIPMARAWLSAARTKVGVLAEERRGKRNRK